MQVIGITGTNGSGKGTIVEYLKTKGFIHYSVSDFLKSFINKKGLPINRDSMIQVANELRKEYGPEYLVEELYKIAEKNGKNCIIESIRTLGEINALQQKGNFSLWAVDANQNIRFERTLERKSEKDSISFEKFMMHEEKEFGNTEPHKQNLRVCIEKATVRLDNNGDLETLYQQINNILK